VCKDERDVGWGEAKPLFLLWAQPQLRLDTSAVDRAGEGAKGNAWHAGIAEVILRKLGGLATDGPGKEASRVRTSDFRKTKA